MTTDVREPQLRRVITRPMLIFFILGDILGAGIYSLTGQVGESSGGAIWASFVIAFLLAFLTAAGQALPANKRKRGNSDHAAHGRVAVTGRSSSKGKGSKSRPGAVRRRAA